MSSTKIQQQLIPARLLSRPFGATGLAAVHEEIEASSPRSRAEIARRVCQRLSWISIGGKYQLMSARVALLRLHRCGLIQLPPPLRGNGNGRGLDPDRTRLPREHAVPGSVDLLNELSLRRVASDEDSALYNGMIDRYHYLGYAPMAGAQMRYLITWERGVVGAMGFGASALKLAPRDRFIGWDHSVREHGLHLIVNNSRFLILPWARASNLASKALSLAARHICRDYETTYGYAPVLLETFVERDRFRGHCYRAANWICVGQSQGRGKNHVRKTPGVPVKDIWLYPLCRNFRRRLQQVESR